MSKKYTCVLADDNELDRLMLRHLLKTNSTLEIMGEYNSAEDVLKYHIDNLPDILFLDIDMGKISGLELRSMLMTVPVCVFISAYPEYALESFEKNALDFIVKPITKDRFASTLLRISEYLNIKTKAQLLDEELGSDIIYIKDGNDKIKIHTYDILYLEAYKDYTKIVTTSAYNIILSSLGNLLSRHPFDKFVRIHRSYAVARHKVQKISTHEVYVGNTILPIGRSYKDTISW